MNEDYLQEALYDAQEDVRDMLEQIAHMNTDYAALEARCAGLERERDALKLSLDECHADSSERGKEADQWQQWCVETRKERDVLQTKLAAYESHGPDGHNATNAQFVEVRSERDAAVAAKERAEESLKLVRTKAIPAGGALVLQHKDWKYRVEEVLDIIDNTLASAQDAKPATNNEE